jgi:UBX domain-containing protein 7
MSSSDGMNDSTDNDEIVSQFLAVTGTSDPATAVNYLEMSGNNLETAVGLYMEHGGGGGGGGSGGGGSGGFGGGGSDMDEGGGAGAAASIMSDIRAPDETRTMRMIDDGGGGGGAAGMGMMGMMGGMGAAMMADPSYRLMHEMMEEQLSLSAFAPTGPSSSLPSAAARSAREAVNAAAAESRGRRGGGDGGDDDDFEYDYDDDDDDMGDESKMDDDDDDDVAVAAAAAAAAALPPQPPRLHDMFAAPTHLMHKAGGFQGARQVAKDSKRWLLVNIQKDSEFASHALNRDVWSNDLVENLIREGFIFWQEV